MPPAHKLIKVQELVVLNKYEICQSSLKRAYDSFDWGLSEIKSAILSLKTKDFVRQETSQKIIGAPQIDVYKGYYDGFEFYAHVHLEDRIDGSQKMTIAVLSCHEWKR